MKFVRVNMTTVEIKTDAVPLEYTGFGGRGLTSLLLSAEVNPGCYSLGPEN